MFSRRISLTLAALALTSAAGLGAQEANRLGLNFSTAFPATAVAVDIPLTRTIVLRPRFGFDRFKDTSGAPAVTTTDAEIGADVLFMRPASGGFRSYWGAGLHLPSSKTSGGSWDSVILLQGLFGARVALHQRLGMFGEVGLQFADDDTFNQIRTMSSAVGVIIYLR